MARPHRDAPTGRYAYLVAGTLAVAYTCNFLDRQFLSVLAEPVKRDLHLTDTQLGLLTGLMFALFYTAFGIPVAVLADRSNRVRIVAAACTLWSLFTAACGFAGSFVVLAAARIGVGVGEAGGSPPSYSILSDYFPPHRRGRALALYSLGVPFGSLFGAASGGWIAAHFGWRTAFKALGASGLLLAPLILLVVREPRRGRLDPPGAMSRPRASVASAMLAFVRKPALGLTALSAGLTAFVGYALLNWTPAFLIREKGMTLIEIAVWYSTVSGLTTAAGTWLAGWLVDRLGPARPAAYALVPGFCMLLALPFLPAMIGAHDWRTALAFVVGPSLLIITYLPAALAVIQNGVEPAQRAVAGSILLFILNLIGLGGGPLFVGAISDHLKPRFGEHALMHALLWLAPFYVLTFLCQLAAAWFLERDHTARRTLSLEPVT
ncbi:MAG: MFS transporter [Caulobacteraceae bacterium]|nr:MFS transporter [Caulobacteraceae bacterium]